MNKNDEDITIVNFSNVHEAVEAWHQVRNRGSQGYVFGLATSLRELEFTDLGWANSGAEKTGPWENPFSIHNHEKCLSLHGDFDRREFYLCDSSD